MATGTQKEMPKIEEFEQRQVVVMADDGVGVTGADRMKGNCSNAVVFWNRRGADLRGAPERLANELARDDAARRGTEPAEEHNNLRSEKRK